MTTVQSVVTQGYREINLIAIGKSPSTPQLDEGLLLMQNILEVTITGDSGERMRDWPLGNFDRQSRDRIQWSREYFANPRINSRLIAVNDEAMTVYLPPSPSDGSLIGIADPFQRLAAFPVTLDGNGRTIEAAASVTANTDGLYRIWFYRADTGNWQRLTDVALTDEMPFPKKYDFYFSIGLAMRLSGRTGRRVSEMTAMTYKAMRDQFVAQYLQNEPMSRVDDLSNEFLSEQAYDRHWTANTDRFNRGEL